MSRGEQTRDKIIESANKLFYEQGFHQTSISDIVGITGLSKGNITYYFRSKDDILKAVIDRRVAGIEATLVGWEKNCSSARARLNCFITNLLEGQVQLTRFGCPYGSLAYELGKTNENTRELSQAVFNLIRDWLTRQFSDLGFSSRQARDRAMELYTRGQGICVLAQVYNDEDLFRHEIKQLKKLIDRP
jgi:AcrR family transcriptional regulator